MTPGLYRKALVMAGMAVAGAAAAWTAQGWRYGREIAELQQAQAKAQVRRSAAVVAEWDKANRDSLFALRAAQEARDKAQAKAATLLAGMQAKQPTGDAWACRELPLPDAYLETFRK